MHRLPPWWSCRAGALGLVGWCVFFFLSIAPFIGGTDQWVDTAKAWPAFITGALVVSLLAGLLPKARQRRRAGEPLLTPDHLTWVKLIGLLLLGGVLVQGIPKGTTDASIGAVTQCELHVRDRLMAPQSARFSMLDYLTTPYPDGRYSVTADFEAENAFGAAVRHRYKCDIRYLGGAQSVRENWTLLDLNID